MIDLSSIATWATILAPLIGGIYTIFRMVRKNTQDHQKKLTNLERRVNLLQEELEALKTDVDKDLQHIKENYKIEISFLSQKISELKNEITTQNTQIMNLLTTLISKD